MHIILANIYSIRGGIPKFVVSLANGLAARGHRITIFSPRPVHPFFQPACKFARWVGINSRPQLKTQPPEAGTQNLDRLYPLANEVEVLPYRLTDKNLELQKLRRKIMDIDPDICVCPLADGSHLLWAVTLLGSGIPHVYSERTSPRNIETLFWNRKGRLAAMSGADAIHLLLPSYAESVPEFLRGRVRIIPNSVAIPDTPADTSGGPQKLLLWTGRLHDELKQCRLALDAFAIASRECPGWRMAMAGTGPDAGMVKKHAMSLGLGGSVTFPGEFDNPGRLLASAQAFCFSSTREGMPNALMEAMAAGLPCAAFSECDGMEEMMPDGEAGLLARETSAMSLAAKLAALMRDAELRKKLGMNARERMKSFAEQTILDSWETLLAETAAAKGHTVMDGFAAEPFASMARMSSRARMECAGWTFGDPPPGSIRGLCRAAGNRIRAAGSRMRKRIARVLS